MLSLQDCAHRPFSLEESILSGWSWSLPSLVTCALSQAAPIFHSGYHLFTCILYKTESSLAESTPASALFLSLITNDQAVIIEGASQASRSISSGTMFFLIGEVYPASHKLIGGALLLSGWKLNWNTVALMHFKQSFYCF